jgi:phosphoribosylformylglycinamidine (FGAM) synthase-like amidotransferase family enzyme
MMPHPERKVIEPAHGGTDGRRLFDDLSVPQHESTPR